MWWKNAIPRHLPLSQGPYVPACLDIMTKCTSQGAFLRVYYPSSLSKQEDHKSKWINWMPHDKYIEGFANIVNYWPSVIRLIVWSNGGVPQVPVVWEGPVLSDKHKLPVIVFSHGFGATRFLSSAIGVEMASQGYVFVALEHREQSACNTYYYETEDDLKNDNKTWIKHEKMNFGPDHYTVRNTQLHKRKEEIINVLDYLEDLNNGKGTNILKTSFDMSSFKNVLDLSSICMMGHSFGGAASLLTMAHDKRLKCGVILDGWMFPVKEEDITVEQPLIFINTQTFHIASNLTVMDKFIKNPEGSSRQVFTMHHTTHESQTDTPLIMGYWLNWFMHKLDPVVGININNHLTLRFLKRHIGIPEDVKESEEYLEKEKENFVSGTYVYSKEAKRKLVPSL